MALEEVGVKLVAQGEAAYEQALNNAAMATDKLGNETEDISGKVDKSTRSFKVMGLSLTDIKSGFDLASGAVRKIWPLIKDTIDAASDLNETTSKSQVVFGEMSGAVEEMGNTAATSMGLSKNAAIAAAATYGNLFVSMGMARDKSAEMSMSLVQLAADLGSFNNLPTADVLEKLRAGLTGESEPLKSLGININETMIKQEALNLGLKVGTGVLDASVKAQAAYSLILKQSTTAQGDFARTADGAANQTKILEAQVANLQAEIGSKLLPAWKEALKLANAGLESIDKLSIMQNGYTDVLKQHENEMKKTAKSYSEYITEMKRAAGVVGQRIDQDGNLRDGMGNLLTANIAVTEAEYNQAQAIATLKAASDTAGPSVDSYTTYWDTYISTAGNAVGSSDALSLAVDGINSKMKTAEGVMEKYTTQLLFNKAAAVLDDEAAIGLAYAMGLVDEKTVYASDQLAILAQQLADKKISVVEYTHEVNLLNDAMAGIKDRSATITIHNVTTRVTNDAGVRRVGGEQEYAEGGVFKIPSGFEDHSWPVGPNMWAKSGETVMIMPDRITAPMVSPVNNYNNSYANNYNLQVMSNNSPAAVQQSFAMMRLLAG